MRGMFGISIFIGLLPMLVYYALSGLFEDGSFRKKALKG
mgnify:CR=1 FL=1